MGGTLIGLVLGYVGLGLMYDSYYHDKVEKIRRNKGFLEAMERIQNPSLSEILLKILFRPIIKIMVDLRLKAIRKEIEKYNGRIK